MKNTDKFFFRLFGVIVPIAIGTMHLVTHFVQLESPEIRMYLGEPISILGQEQPYWNTWGITSIMMGWAFIIIGIQNMVIMNSNQTKVPSLAFISMTLYLVGVVYVGYRFDAIPQLILGSFALMIFTVLLLKRVITRPMNNKT